MAKQVCVFAENKPGRLERITGLLEEAEINIRAITIATSQGFGVVKLIVQSPEATIELLKKHGCAAYSREVIAALMDDRPGGLHAIARAFSGKGINIEDAYGFVVKDKQLAVMILDVEGIPEALKVLTDAGIAVLTDEQLYAL